LPRQAQGWSCRTSAAYVDELPPAAAAVEAWLARVDRSDAGTALLHNDLKQVLGGTGIPAETLVEMIFRDIPALRLQDGPIEVYKHAIAWHLLRVGTDM
jgi:alkylation response protein AidB-like acyl-CoA dehydrogenase